MQVCRRVEYSHLVITEPHTLYWNLNTFWITLIISTKQDRCDTDTKHFYVNPRHNDLTQDEDSTDICFLTRTR